MRLCELKPGESATVRALLSIGGIRRRLMDIGVIDGTTVTCVGRSPGGDPAAYAICGAVIAIRDRESAEILVDPLERGALPWG
ncbi:MAG: ferrous iron transport protein A [Clostridia bacterium]|nr:ferrous iron transport protein A [Clostridia bacterium]